MYWGEIKESDEMLPAWFSCHSIPYQDMWADDEFWMPHLLVGRCFEGRFMFRGESVLVAQEVRVVTAMAIADPATAVPLPASMPQQGAIEL